MPTTSDRLIAEVLRSVNSIALLGASQRPERPSYEVMQFLLSRGYDVIPVNPAIGDTEILGQKVYSSLEEIPRHIDMVDVFRNSSHLSSIVRDIVKQSIGIIWTQLDVIDTEAAQYAESHGIRVIMNRCPAIEWPRLEHIGLL
jgi:predicted CoA-binding protein